MVCLLLGTVRFIFYQNFKIGNYFRKFKFEMKKNIHITIIYPATYSDLFEPTFRYRPLSLLCSAFCFPTDRDVPDVRHVVIVYGDC